MYDTAELLQQTAADQAVFLSSHLVRIWALPRAARAGSTPPRCWADSRLRVQRARVRRHARGPEEHMRCRYAENRKMSVECGCIAFYDLFICFFSSTCQRHFCGSCLWAWEDLCQPLKGPEKWTHFPEHWLCDSLTQDTHTHTRTHKMHGTETQADNVIDCAIVLHLTCVKLLQLTKFCQMFDIQYDSLVSCAYIIVYPQVFG